MPSAATDLAAQIIAFFEGLHRLGKDNLVHPYLCPAGIPTIGYGHVVASLQVLAITRDQARTLLLQDVAAAILATAQACPVLVHQPPARFAAVVSFTYNLGAARLRASTMRKRINAREWVSAGNECRKWVYGGGRKLPGLIIRRELEARCLATGEPPQLPAAA